MRVPTWPIPPELSRLRVSGGPRNGNSHIHPPVIWVYLVVAVVLEAVQNIPPPAASSEEWLFGVGVALTTVDAAFKRHLLDWAFDDCAPPLSDKTSPSTLAHYSFPSTSLGPRTAALGSLTVALVLLVLIILLMLAAWRTFFTAKAILS